ncbi:hypothetical protein O1M54_50240 [Streptomyces diastatochromogenes]|nr:hypothetical protein [Streptomyces diastatochromogenes]
MIAALASLIGGLVGALIARGAAVRAARINAEASVATKRYEAQLLAYQAFQTSLNLLRRSITATDVVLADLEAADQVVHDNINVVSSLAPKDVADIAIDIGWTCRTIREGIQYGDIASPDERNDAWRTRIQPKREALNVAIREHSV